MAKISRYDTIDTPAVIINMAGVEKNIHQMQAAASESGIKLRPHIKTHKIPRLAKMQIDAGAMGVTCAKVSEAEALAAAGIDDIFIAYPIVGGGKPGRIARLAKKVRLRVGADSLAAAHALSDAAIAEGATVGLMLEIDTGLARTGAAPYMAPHLAKSIQALPGLRFDGIYTFKGATLRGASTRDLAAAAAEERDAMLACAQSIRDAGVPVSEISGGSTPTAMAAFGAGGLTEVRSGTYIFYDMMGVGMGLIPEERCAARVLATVVSTPSPTLAVIDAGSKSVSSDFTLGTPPYHFRAYATVEGRPDLLLARMNEEHGMLRGVDAAGADAPTGLSVGDRVLLIPNHVCTTVNLYNFVYFEDGQALERVPVALRGLVY